MGHREGVTGHCPPTGAVADPSGLAAVAAAGRGCAALGIGVGHHLLATGPYRRPGNCLGRGGHRRLPAHPPCRRLQGTHRQQLWGPVGGFRGGSVSSPSCDNPLPRFHSFPPFPALLLPAATKCWPSHFATGHHGRGRGAPQPHTATPWHQHLPAGCPPCTVRGRVARGRPQMQHRTPWKDIAPLGVTAADRVGVAGSPLLLLSMQTDPNKRGDVCACPPPCPTAVSCLGEAPKPSRGGCVSPAAVPELRSGGGSQGVAILQNPPLYSVLQPKKQICYSYAAAQRGAAPLRGVGGGGGGGVPSLAQGGLCHRGVPATAPEGQRGEGRVQVPSAGTGTGTEHGHTRELARTGPKQELLVHSAFSHLSHTPPLHTPLTGTKRPNCYGKRHPRGVGGSSSGFLLKKTQTTKQPKNTPNPPPQKKNPSQTRPPPPRSGSSVEEQSKGGGGQRVSWEGENSSLGDPRGGSGFGFPGGGSPGSPLAPVVHRVGGDGHGGGHGDGRAPHGELAVEGVVGAGAAAALTAGGA